MTFIFGNNTVWALTVNFSLALVQLFKHLRANMMQLPAYIYKQYRKDYWAKFTEPNPLQNIDTKKNKQTNQCKSERQN